MNPARTLALAFLAPLVFSLGASAQEPREDLKTLIERLRKNPADGALREEVIRLARDMTPPPATPREALQHEAAGDGLIKKAKSRQDCLAAAHEYELALRLAPWVAPLYFALGEAYEKLGDLESAAPSANSKKYPACSQPAYAAEATRFFGHERARENFEFYLLAKPGVSEQDSAGVRYRIEEIKLRFAWWWQDACCDGCGGKRNSKR